MAGITAVLAFLAYLAIEILPYQWERMLAITAVVFLVTWIHLAAASEMRRRPILLSFHCWSF